MKKIYLSNSNGSLKPSRIIDVDSLSFAFNRVDGSIYATSTAFAKTSEVIILHHPNWKKINDVDKLIFESEAMDKLTNALDHLFSSNSNILEIEFGCSETSVVYTFKTKHACPADDDYIDNFEISLLFEKG